MAKFLLEDVYVELDGHDISDHCFRVDTPSTRDRVDVSGFNPSGAKEFLSGTKEDSIVLGVLQDFSAGGVHDILVDLYQNQSTFTVRVRPTSAVVSDTNPELSGTAQMLEYDGLSGDISNRAEIQVTLIPADSAGFAWADT